MPKHRSLAAILVAAVVLAGCTSTPPSPRVPVRIDDLKSVAILILDEFSIDGPRPVPTGGGNCAYTEPTGALGTSGAGALGTSGAGIPAASVTGVDVNNDGVIEGDSDRDGVLDADLDRDGVLVHGELVHSAIAGELDATPGLTRTSDGWKVDIAPETRLSLVPVHIANLSIAAVTASIRAKIDEMNDEYDGFVLNMSFVAVPCDVVSFLFGEEGAPLAPADLVTHYLEIVERSPQYAKLKADLDSLVGASRTAKEVLTHIMTKPQYPWATVTALIIDLIYRSVWKGGKIDIPDEEILRDEYWQQFVQDVVVGGSVPVIPVGAAGNGVSYPTKPTEPGVSYDLQHQSLPFPFAPAMWSAVASVSASDGLGNLAAYSNGGEVMLNGEVTVVEGQEPWVGTSFAAPRLAALEAIYLVAGEPATCGQHIPPLSYAEYISTNDLSGDATFAAWKNLRLNVAVNDYCGDFLKDLTTKV